MDELRAPDGHTLDVFNSQCPSRAMLRDVTGRWAPLILIALEDGLTRFGDLHRRIDGSNQRMLSQTLGVLAEDGLITRRVDDGGRPRYELTNDGHDITRRVRHLRDAIYRHLASTAGPTAEAS